jgi:branched-subunit amino acid transport protein
VIDFLVFAAVGVGAYLFRGSFILAVGDRHLPPVVERALRNVGPAVLGALVASLLLTDGVGAFVGDPARIAGVAVAIVVALKTRSFAPAFLLAMAVFWLVRWIVLA